MDIAHLTQLLDKVDDYTFDLLQPSTKQTYACKRIPPKRIKSMAKGIIDVSEDKQKIFQKEKIKLICELTNEEVKADTLTTVDVISMLAQIISQTKIGDVHVPVICKACDGMVDYVIEFDKVINTCSECNNGFSSFTCVENGITIEFIISQPTIKDVIKLGEIYGEDTTELRLNLPLLYVTEMNVDDQPIDDFGQIPLADRLDMFTKFSPYILFGEKSLSMKINEEFGVDKGIIESPYCEKCDKSLGPIITSDHFFNI